MARKPSALYGFYDYGVHDAEVLTHSPAASVRRPRVSDESRAVGPTADELRLLLVYAAQHSPRLLALVSLLTFCGLRISEALNADIRDYGHDHGHRVQKVTRKGGKTARIALAPPVVRALDDYLNGRTSCRIFVGRAGEGAYGYRLACAQLGRLCRNAGLPAGVTPHSLRHSYATESQGSAPPCRTSKTPSATPTPAPPVARTAAATTSTASPTTSWPPHSRLVAARSTTSSSYIDVLPRYAGVLH